MFLIQAWENFAVNCKETDFIPAEVGRSNKSRQAALCHRTTSRMEKEAMTSHKNYATTDGMNACRLQNLAQCYNYRRTLHAYHLQEPEFSVSYRPMLSSFLSK
jgi:hypothetical protein